jgi:hypothetical protein
MASQQILEADYIIIYSGQWNHEILKFIKEELNKEFKPENIKIVDFYFG